MLCFAGCGSVPAQPDVIVKDNTAKDDYISKIEAIVSDAAAGVKAVKEKLDKNSIEFKMLENQEIRLSGINPPSVVKLDEYRANIANNDTKATAKDKVEAEKVDEQTSELYATVAALDSQLTAEQLRSAEKDRLAERALKEQFRTSLQNYGLYLTIAGILVIAFLKNLFKSGIVMILGGVILVITAYFAEHPALIWIIGVTAALVAVEILFFGFKYIKEHLGRKNLRNTETQ